jgi:hypothetical protein
MVGVHRSVGLERAEGMQGENQNHFAYSKYDDLSNTRRLNSTDSNTTDDGEQDRDEGKRRRIIRISIVEGSVGQNCGKVVEQVGARACGEDEPEDPGGYSSNDDKHDDCCRDDGSRRARANHELEQG